MKNSILILSVFFVLCFTGNTLFSQSSARVENIDFYAVGSNLTITYEIAKAKAGEYFEVWVKITTDSGKEIVPIAMTGDVGKNVTGGENKRIIWDIEADNATIDEEISVEVFAKSMGIPKTIEEPTTTKDDYNVKDEPKAKGNVSVGKALILSAVLPGLGNRYVKGKGAPWLIGVAGYGMIAGSILMNNSAYNAYEDYKVETDATQRSDFYDSAKSKKSISTVLAGTAIAIWVADLVWTGIQAGSANKKGGLSKVSLNYHYEPMIGKPMIGLNYKF
ncbi:MAG: hypothetical protein R2764_05600 [Bacteroidales bacterium]